MSLLRLEHSLEFTENLHPINLPTQLSLAAVPHDSSSEEVLHTIMGQHSFNIPIIRIDTTECILDDYTINRFLGGGLYCARQKENKYCINGYGEQVYTSKVNTLYGLVSMGHKNEADCVNNNSLIITELGLFSDSIRNAICGDRR